MTISSVKPRHPAAERAIACRKHLSLAVLHLDYHPDTPAARRGRAMDHFKMAMEAISLAVAELEDQG